MTSGRSGPGRPCQGGGFFSARSKAGACSRDTGRPCSARDPACGPAVNVRDFPSRGVVCRLARVPLYGLITEDGHAVGVEKNGSERDRSASTATVERVGGHSDRDPTGVIDELLGGENVSRVSLYREKPTSAGGHLETIDVFPGEGLDLESIHREWGGGTIRFRPLDERGKYAGRSVTVKFSGPPLWHGRPLDHRGQPLDGAERVIDVPATTRYGSPLPATTSRGGEHYEAVRVLGDAFGAMMERLDRIEDRISEPRSNPNDPSAMLAQLTGMAKTMGTLKKLFGEADSLGAIEDDEPEPSPKMPSWQDMLPMLLLSKLGGEGGGGLNPAMLAAMAPPGMMPPGFAQAMQQPPQPPHASQHAAPPRPPQPPPQPQTVAPSEVQRPAQPPRPEQVAAMLARVPPEQRGAYVAQVMQAMGVQAPPFGGPPEQGGDDGPRADPPHAPGADPFASDDGDPSW